MDSDSQSVSADGSVKDDRVMSNVTGNPPSSLYPTPRDGPASWASRLSATMTGGPTHTTDSVEDGSPTDEISLAYEQEYGRKLGLIEEIREELNLENIRAPGVVVIGSQSAGKSSVLARLTGVSFPTGDNICTRTPTVVHTKVDPHIRGFTASISDDASFSHAVSCANMDDLRIAISDFTSKLASGGTSVCNKPIYIRHTRKSGPVMTLIDLPGITHFDPVNEHFDIHAATCDIVRKYVADDNIIMLVVIPATEDFSNSEALRIALQYDPTGERTVGVVSKCDMVPHTSDILDKVRMTRPSDVQLALGFVAVRNRASHETSDDVDIDHIETTLFQSHPQLKQLSDKQKGLSALTEKIVALQGQAVDRFFAHLRRLIRSRKDTLTQKLEALPHIPRTPDARRDELLDVLCAIDRHMRALLHTEDVSQESLNIPSSTYDLCETFSRDLLAHLPNALGEPFADAVRLKQNLARGRLLPDVDVDTVVAQQVREVLFGSAGRSNNMGIVHSCTNELISSHSSLMTRVYELVITQHTNVKVFPLLADVISSQLARFIHGARKSASLIAEAIIDAEKSSCYTQNPLYLSMVAEVRRAAATGGRLDDFSQDRRRRQGGKDGIDETGVFRNCPLLRVCPSLMRQDNVDESDYVSFLTRFIDEAGSQSDTWSVMRAQFSIHCYLHVVVKRLSDVIPMVVRNALVYQLHDTFVSHVSRALCEDPAVLEAAMRESPKDREIRQSLEGRFEKLETILRKMAQLGLADGD